VKKILCYGDSNIFGFIPGQGARYPKNERWSGILGEILPQDYFVIEEGMNNRTGFFKNPDGGKYSGGEYLPVVLDRYRDIDICILALGTNDAQFIYNLDKKTTCIGLQNLINCIRKTNNLTKIIIIPPVKIDETILEGNFSILFNKKSIEIINLVFPIFEQVAKDNNCYYLDINKIASPSRIDGLHYTKEAHRSIAESVADFICSI